MSKRNILLSMLLLAWLLTACNSGASIPPTIQIEESISTLVPTHQLAAASTSQPANEPAPLPSPTFTADRIFIMGWGWADKEKEFNEEMIRMTIQGNGLEKMDLSLESNLDISILVSIVPGTLFETSSPSTQTMVARELREIVLEPHAEISIELEVACANMRLNAPGSADSYTAVYPPAIPNLSKLVSSISFIEHGSFRVQQFAIWIVTDDAINTGFVGLGSIGPGSGPSEDEMRQIQQLFEDAGISMDEY